jgi:hypothetical protein
VSKDGSHIHHVPRLRMRGSVPPFLCIFS